MTDDRGLELLAQLLDASHDLVPSRAFATVAVQEADSGSGRRLWLPLLDGAERLGVLGLTLPSVDGPLVERCAWLATLIAELLVSKDQYTDRYSTTRRRQPMSLADLVVRETLAGQPAAETMRRLAHAILAHQGTKPRDDATMVFLERPGPWRGGGHVQVGRDTYNAAPERGGVVP